MQQLILVINSGSSTIKWSLFNGDQLVYHGSIDSLFTSPCLRINDAQHISIFEQQLKTTGHKAALKAFFDWLQQQSLHMLAVGHRVVHGGNLFLEPTLVTAKALQAMASLSPLAPLHQPHNLEAIRIINSLFPKLPQVACFDTTFHRTQHPLAKLFALPRALTAAGIIRYGFHGLSYEYIASVITDHLGELGKQRVIVAHLGNGASMCAMYARKSVATSMGFTALDGLMMGTRCGQIDPGVALYLMQEQQYSAKEVEQLFYNESGLLGVSGISNDMRNLLSLQDPHAQEAIDLFCYKAALEVGSLTAALNGCDALIFTAGIGEKAPLIRHKICQQLAWLGIKLHDAANTKNAGIISSKQSKLVVGVIPTNEEYMIAKHTQHLLN